MLSTLLLILLPLLVVLFIERVLTLDDPLAPSIVITVLIGVVVVAYRLSRTVHYQGSAFIIVIAILVFALIELWLNPSEIAIAFLAINLIVVALFLSIRMTIFIAIIDMLSAVLTAVLLTDLAVQDIMSGISFLFIMSGLIIFASIIREHDVQRIRRHSQEWMEIEKRDLELVAEQRRVQALQQFIGDASHDLKTPLTTLSTTVYLLKHDLGDEKAKRVAVLEAEIDRLIKMVEDMFYMAALDGQYKIDTLQVIKVNQLVNNVVQQQLKEAQQRQLTLRFEPAPHELTILAIQREFQRALVNLIDNAINYTPPGGEVVVSTMQREGDVIIKISDTGIGIADDDLQHIFDRFYRADKARSIVTGGSGLGLSIAQRIIELQGGRIEVTSVYGKGSTFCVVMPLANPIRNDENHVQPAALQ